MPHTGRNTKMQVSSDLCSGVPVGQTITVRFRFVDGIMEIVDTAPGEGTGFLSPGDTLDCPSCDVGLLMWTVEAGRGYWLPCQVCGWEAV